MNIFINLSNIFILKIKHFVYIFCVLHRKCERRGQIRCAALVPPTRDESSQGQLSLTRPVIWIYLNLFHLEKATSTSWYYFMFSFLLNIRIRWTGDGISIQLFPSAETNGHGVVEISRRLFARRRTHWIAQGSRPQSQGNTGEVHFSWNASLWRRQIGSSKYKYWNNSIVILLNQD